jgi:ribosome biogenesis protein BRX1
MSLVEIGPRFVLTPIRIFEGAFGGATVFANPGMGSFFIARAPPTPWPGRYCCFVIFKAFRFCHPTEFVPPSLVRSARRKDKGERYKERKLAQQEQGIRRTERKREEDPLAVAKVFS